MTDETMWHSVLHKGVIGTFLKAPHTEATALAPGAPTAAILGFPFDAMCISRTGTNYGPRALREASEQFTPYCANLDLDLRDHMRLVDCGDVPVVPGNAPVSMDAAEALLSAILASGAMPVMFGGDHSVTIAGVRAFAKARKRPGLILVDHHFDTAQDVGGEPLSHCCPITRAVDAGFDPSKIAIVATGGWMNPKSEFQYIHDHGIQLFPIEMIEREGAAAVAQKAAAVASDGTDGVYLTYDIDAIDAAHAPGTGVPTPGGLTSREAIAIAATLGKAADVQAMDLVEVSPAWDNDGITSRLGVRLVLDFLAGTTRR
ncbi:MAG: agmatinase [Pseudomonadota bacterium]